MKNTGENTENNEKKDIKELELDLDLSSGKTDPTISDSVFESEFGGFLPEQSFFIPQLG